MGHPGSGGSFDPVLHELQRGACVNLPTFADAPSGRWSELAARAARNDKPAILMTAVVTGALSDPREIRLGLEDAWTTCEWPGRAADYELWLNMFELALEEGHYLAETELRSHEDLPESVTVYRAAAEGHELGLSWTTSFERAHWFATRLGAIAGGQHRIHELEVPREQVLAHFHATRGEHEFVIDTTPMLLEDLREVLPEEWEYLLEQAASES